MPFRSLDGSQASWSAFSVECIHLQSICGYSIDITVLYLVAIFACYAGLLLWVLFLRLDSLRYPLKTYGDVAERILGKVARHICTFLQTLQLVVLVGVHCNRLLLGCVTDVS